MRAGRGVEPRPRRGPDDRRPGNLNVNLLSIGHNCMKPASLILLVAALLAVAPAVAREGRDFFVYTPPHYDPAGKEEYPVLYLLHGITDDAGAWSTAGRAHVILDNLIARGKTKPMLVVMPLGYGFPNVPENLFKLF